MCVIGISRIYHAIYAYIIHRQVLEVSRAQHARRKEIGMARLTEWDEYGNADIIALSEIMPEMYAGLSFSETNALTDAINQLAAYEDTGLTPLEIANFQPVKHGKWNTIIDPYGKIEGWICECGRESKEKSKYCPNCGARMDGGK